MPNVYNVKGMVAGIFKKEKIAIIAENKEIKV